MRMTVPDFCLVVLVGASGAGKSSFAAAHFKPTEVISSDYCRSVVADDENDMSATADAFELLHFIVGKRLAGRRLTVVDATNVQREDRKRLVMLARSYHALPVALVLNLPEELCQARNAARPNRDFGPHVVRNHVRALRRGLRGLGREGFRHVHVMSTPEEVDAAVIERQRLWTDRRHEHGPFDIIGDIHGCYDELRSLLHELGYRPDAGIPVHADGRKPVFLGDLVDRGPASPAVLRLVMAMTEADKALCVVGNHDAKLMRKLRGRKVQITHGLAETLEQLESETPEFHQQVARYIDKLVSHYVLDDGKLVVAHAGLKEELQGRASGAVRAFAMFGETTGETDEFGLPVRYNWAGEYRGSARVVYGHSPVPEAEWLNRTICIDTGCVFGGKLTALRYPELDLVSVPAAKQYFEPARPLVTEPAAGGLGAQQAHDDLLDMADVAGKRLIATSLHRSVTIREENAAAALEVMSRFAADPRWLIYLPPTMAPTQTSDAPGLLEHPAEAFDYFEMSGVGKVVCEEKHMGSRAIVVLCRDEAAARRRFGVDAGETGLVYTRTGRPFFSDEPLHAAFLARLRAAFDSQGLWDSLETDWACLDGELMPWSAKAQGLIREQYARVGAAARVGLAAAEAAVDAAHARGVEIADLQQRMTARRSMATAYVDSYRRYCWPVDSLDGLKFAPFHLLATEGAVYDDKPHDWHMETLAGLCSADPSLLLATPWRSVSLDDPAGRQATTDWWVELTEAGGEGMVVKPRDFISRGPKGLVQPALKCRGREYLRIIYGPDYTAPEHLERLRKRGLAHKRSMAMREFALGLEALRRFVDREPLRHVHECVFGVLALESEPVDPRL